MNQILKYAAYCLLTAGLFVGSFLSFAALSGAPMHEMSVVGKFFPEPPEIVESVAGEPDLTEEMERDLRSSRTVVEQAATPLQAFLLQSPFTTKELEDLQRELKSRVHDLDILKLNLEGREREIALRERQLEERWAELETIRNGLIEEDLELEQRKDELTRDERVQAERESASWKSLAKVFETGKAKDLAKNLVLFAPGEAARVLSALSDERASELLNSVPREKWAEYAEAYRKAQK